MGLYFLSGIIVFLAVVLFLGLLGSRKPKKYYRTLTYRIINASEYIEKNNCSGIDDSILKDISDRWIFIDQEDWTDMNNHKLTFGTEREDIWKKEIENTLRKYNFEFLFLEEKTYIMWKEAML